jgi:hypothetical protein
MQYTSNELYNEVSCENNIPLHKVKFVGDIIFNAINTNLKEPQAIILKIKNIGKFYMRKNKLDSEVEYLKGELEKEENPKQRDKLNNLLLRQVEYNKYLEDKQNIKRIRHGNQTIINVEIPLQEEDV